MERAILSARSLDTEQFPNAVLQSTPIVPRSFSKGLAVEQGPLSEMKRQDLLKENMIYCLIEAMTFEAVAEEVKRAGGPPMKMLYTHK